MSFNRDIRYLDRSIAKLEKNIAENSKELERYKISISNSISIIESLDADIMSERNSNKEKNVELNTLIEDDENDRYQLEELRIAFEYLKNGKPDVKAFNNPRPASEKKISFF